MSRLNLIALILLTATSCSENQSARRDASNPLPQIGLGMQDFNGTHNLALAEHGYLRSAAQKPPGGTGGEQREEVADLQPNKTVLVMTAVPATADRQIIYRAALYLRVTSFADTESKISALVKVAGGFVSQFNEDRSSGAQRGGRWTVRLPAPNFTSFLDSAAQLGVADRREVQSQDVTEEYVDLEARLKNKQALESRLLDLVANRSDHIKDVIALETELSRVREEIERLQGRLRYLKDHVSLTTVEISAYERLDYEPPEASFSGKVAGTLWESLDGLRRLAEGTILLVVALSPWALAIAIFLVPMLSLIRRRLNDRQTQSTSAA